MDFTLNMSGTVEVDDSIVKEYAAEFRVALAEQGVGAQFASLKTEIGGESISMPKYDQLGLAITPLTEKEDVESEALSDSKVIIMPEEYGKAVTTTKLASLQTRGMSDSAAARVVGINAGRTENRLALLAMDASTNVFNAGNTQTDIMTGSIMGKMYNRMARANAVGVANGEFVMIAHDDVIHDIRESGAWVDAHKYALPNELLRNEVGMYKGFRVVRDNLSTVADVSGVDVYNSYFVGFNAYGKATSQPIGMTATGPFDKLARFINLGWYGVFNYKIIEQQALWVAQTASSALQ